MIAAQQQQCVHLSNYIMYYNLITMQKSERGVCIDSERRQHRRAQTGARRRRSSGGQQRIITVVEPEPSNAAFSADVTARDVPAVADTRLSHVAHAPHTPKHAIVEYSAQFWRGDEQCERKCGAPAAYERKCDCDEWVCGCAEGQQEE